MAISGVNDVNVQPSYKSKSPYACSGSVQNLRSCRLGVERPQSIEMQYPREERARYDALASLQTVDLSLFAVRRYTDVHHCTVFIATERSSTSTSVYRVDCCAWLHTPLCIVIVSDFA